MRTPCDSSSLPRLRAIGSGRRSRLEKSRERPRRAKDYGPKWQRILIPRRHEIKTRRKVLSGAGNKLASIVRQRFARSRVRAAKAAAIWHQDRKQSPLLRRLPPAAIRQISLVKSRGGTPRPSRGCIHWKNEQWVQFSGWGAD
jgi:hypothetical protein